MMYLLVSSETTTASPIMKAVLLSSLVIVFIATAMEQTYKNLDYR